MPNSQTISLWRSRSGAVALIVLLVPFLTGCWVQSVYPFYEDSDVVADSAFVGAWVGEGELNTCLLNISLNIPTRTYTLSVSKSSSANADAQCEAVTFEGKLLQFGQERYLDVVSDPEKSWPATLDTLLKVDSDKQKLAFTPLDPDWVAGAMSDKTVKLQGRIQEFGLLPRFVAVTLISPTGDLREFLRQADAKAAFSETGKMRFLRK
jgi:hypothetical protein